MLDPQARALLQRLAALQLPPLADQTPVQARALYRDRLAITQPAAPPLPRVVELAPAGPGGPLPMRLYRGVAGEAPLPVLVYLHGGGWVVGDLDSHDVVCRTLALEAGCAVLSVDYRLGPEHRFPAAVDETLAACRWVLAEGAAAGLDPRRMAVGGDSAGGNLAAVAALALRDAAAAGEANAPALCGQLLIYPATDMRCTAASHQHNGSGYLLTRESLAWYQSHYLAPGQQADWRASPLLAASHAGLPPALVLTAGFDPLRDEGLQYADALSAAGTVAQQVCFERQIHGFITMGRVIDEAGTALSLCAAALRRWFARPA